MVSTRRSQTDKNHLGSKYWEGAKVEVFCDNGLAFGTLLYKANAHLNRNHGPPTLPSSSSSSFAPSTGAATTSSPLLSSSSSGVTRWMVSMEGSLEEEIVSEHKLGRIVMDGKHPTESDESTVTTNNVTTPSSSTASPSNDSTNAKKGANSLSLSPSSPWGVSSSNNNNKKACNAIKVSHNKVVSAKYQLKQQKAKKGKFGKRAMGSGGGVRASTRSATRSAGHSVELFKGIDAITLPKKVPKSSSTTARTTAGPSLSSSSSSGLHTRHGEPVIKMPMLTGILYLYQGKNRRAEFVRNK